MMLGLLMARAGLEVRLLEVHGDFERDFRGDTVHASTLEILEQLGLAERALQIPHAKLRHIALNTQRGAIQIGQLDRLPSKYNYIAVMPQASLLEMLCAEAEKHPNFQCWRQTGVTDLLSEGGAVRGVRYKRDGDEQTLRASLTVAADGRFSRIRRLSGLPVHSEAPPMDVCWFRLERRETDGHETGGFFVGNGRMLVCIPRVGEWQIGYVFPKGDFGEIRKQGLPAFRAGILQTARWLGERIERIQDWDQLHLLQVKGDCLEQWHKPGLLLIGDAAHVMTPVGGVGINMAIGDAVEAANVLAQGQDPLLKHGAPPDTALAEIQKRRMRATKITQAVQNRIQQVLVARAVSDQEFDLPAPVKLLLKIPGLRQLPLRVMALGFPQAKLE
jgi:2-polyprenyl-6-methoxyphenol hydroxylase-like FAD-dependent oxidoreductase